MAAMLVELFINSIPIRILHFVYAVVAVFVYIIFSLIYWSLGGTNFQGNDYVYPVLNWSESPQSAVVVAVGLLISIFLFNFILFLWTLARDELQRLSNSSSFAMADK